MTPIDRFERHLPDRLVELANPQLPDYLDDLLTQTARNRQRPAWTFPERWIPMALIIRTGAPVRPFRQTWLFLAIVALTLAMVAGLAVVGARLLQPAPQDRAFNSLMTVPTLERADTWDATTIDGLSKPSSMDVGPDGNLYVVNAGNDEILVIDPSGTVLRRWGTTGTGQGQFDFLSQAADPYSAIGGLDVAPDGSIYVADTVNDRVQQFAPSGSFVRTWGSFGPADGEFLHPFDLAVEPDGNVLVVDDRRGDIQRFTPDGIWLAAIGSQGTGDGRLNDTGGIVVDRAGAVINADYGNHRIQAWDPTGGYLWSQAMGTQPMDVAAADDGGLYVPNSFGIDILGPDQTLLGSWRPQDVVGEDRYGVAVAPGGTVYVSSLGHDAIYRLSVGEQQVDMSPEPTTGAAASSSPAASTFARPSIAPAVTTFRAGAPFPIPFTLDLPVRWSQSGGSQQTSRGLIDTVLTRDPEHTPAYVSVFIPINAFADPCHVQDGPISPQVGPTVDDLTQALTHAVGMRAGPVSDVVIDGYQGKEFLLDNNIDITTCSDDPWLPQWTFDSAKSGPVVEEKASLLPGAEERIAILDVKGTRVLILGWTIGSRLDEVQETWQVMDSIDFQ